MTHNASLDISEVAKQSGLPASTLRFYEEKQLISSIGRRGLKRLFAYNILEQLDFIALAQRAGFSLTEITEMFNAHGFYKVNRDKLREKAQELDIKIKQLQATRDGLLHAADCGAPSHRECPTFQRLLKLAGKSAARKKA